MALGITPPTVLGGGPNITSTAAARSMATPIEQIMANLNRYYPQVTMASMGVPVQTGSPMGWSPSVATPAQMARAEARAAATAAANATSAGPGLGTVPWSERVAAAGAPDAAARLRGAAQAASVPGANPLATPAATGPGLGTVPWGERVVGAEAAQAARAAGNVAPSLPGLTSPAVGGSAARAAAAQAASGTAPVLSGITGPAAAMAGGGGAGVAGTAAGLVDDVAAGFVPRAGSLAANQLAAGKPMGWAAARLAGADGAAIKEAGLGARSFGPGALGRAGLYGAAGVGGKMIFDSIVGEQDGVVDDAIGTGILGAGAGAGIGSLIVPGLGTAIGAGIGGVGGMLWGALRGGDSENTKLNRAIDKASSKYDDVIGQLGVSEELRQQGRQLLTAQLSTAEGEDEAKQALNQVIANVAAMAPQDAALRKEKQRREAQTLAMQAWMGPMMQQLLDRQNVYALQSQDIMNSVADQYTNPALAQATRAQAANIPLTNNTQAMMLLAQLGTTPGMYGYDLPPGTETAGPNADTKAITQAQRSAQDQQNQLLQQQLMAQLQGQG